MISSLKGQMLNVSAFGHGMCQKVMIVARGSRCFSKRGRIAK